MHVVNAARAFCAVMFDVELVAALDEPPQPLSATAPSAAAAIAPAPVRRGLEARRRAAASSVVKVGAVKVPSLL
jgi:hypothetical protein